MSGQQAINSFKDLTVWQKAVELTVLVYSISKQFPHEEIYGLTSQLRRASVSVSSNIAEGFKRTSRKEKIQFYTIALGSLAEVESQLEVARALGFIEEVKILEAQACIQRVAMMLEKLCSSARDRASV